MSDREQEAEMAELDADGSATAASVGVHLRQAREARGESVEEVAHALKLRPRQIEAIEAGRFDLLPGHAFVRGFVRNYSRYLGVDVESMMAALNVRNGTERVDLAPVTNAKGVMPAGRTSGGLLRGLLFLVVAGVIVMGAGWYFDWFRVAPGDGPQMASVNAETNAEDNAPARLPALVGAMGSADMADEEDAGAPAFSEPAPDDELPAVIDAPLAEPLAMAEGDDEVASAVDEDGVAEDDDLRPGASESASGGDSLVLRTEVEAWIEVRDGGGSVVYSGTEPAGSTLELESEPPYSLVIGNAGAVSLEYRGESVDLMPHTRSSGVARLELE